MCFVFLKKFVKSVGYYVFFYDTSNTEIHAGYIKKIKR